MAGKCQHEETVMGVATAGCTSAIAELELAYHNFRFDRFTSHKCFPRAADQRSSQHTGCLSSDIWIPFATPILRHRFAIGHISHFGALGVQISRPSEIMFTCKE